MFQNSFRPSGIIEQGKSYFSGNHKLYGSKVEISVLPIGLAVDSSEIFPGSAS